MSAKALFESNLSSGELLFRGKVRDVYDLGDALCLVASDRLSAFDVVLPTPIPGKGCVLNQMSRFWFERTKNVIQNHIIDVPFTTYMSEEEAAILEPRSLIVHKAKPVKIEAIVRGYLAGSGWAEYQRQGSVCGIALPDGLQESSQLPEAIFTPSTKADQGEHDENISFDVACDIVGRDVAEKVRTTALSIYTECAAFARTKGLILADTKMEFGVLPDGELILIDELLTPDSSRFWDAHIYEPGKSQPSFDKQYVRDWLKDSGWNKTPPGPVLPADVVTKTVEKYTDAMVRLTGSGPDYGTV